MVQHKKGSGPFLNLGFMKQFNKIAIIGVGLIGGSIGLAVKRKNLAREIVGVCRHKQSLQKAARAGAIDEGSLDCKDAVSGADLVILATPVNQIIRLAKKIIPYLKRGCLVTDVGSTKLEIVRSIEKAYAREQFHFVGAHPLAGSEEKGVIKARADLFEGAICILTRTGRTDSSALKKVAAFWSKIGCRTKVLTARRHDKVVALISHLPHLAAAQLVKVAKGNLDFASSGFSDTTRIASSSAEIWVDIFLTNKKFITQAIDRYIKNLRLVKDLISRGDKARLSAEFKKIKTLRDALQK